jgi:hypothetical protein
MGVAKRINGPATHLDPYIPPIPAGKVGVTGYTRSAPQRVQPPAPRQVQPPPTSSRPYQKSKPSNALLTEKDQVAPHDLGEPLNRRKLKPPRLDNRAIVTGTKINTSPV